MKIAFFTLNAYDMLTGGHEGDAVGGAQLQQILIGKELANRGHDVYFVEYNDSMKKEEQIEGIQVVTKPVPTGNELSRAITVVRGTTSVFNRIEPDVCYRRSLDFEILPLSLIASMTDTRFVYGIAHDDELTHNPHKFSTGIKSTKLYRRMNRRALSNTSTVIAQNPIQYDLATKRLKTTVHQIPNCYDANKVEPIDWGFKRPVVFWAARFEPWKQPELVAELAKELPEITFVMAGGAGDKELYDNIKDRSQNINNLKLIGHVPFSEIDRYFAAADIFLNTSKKEGFPNTFLQAWSQNTPVVSLRVDPNNILSCQNIGFAANGSVIRLRNKIQELANGSKHLKQLGQASREYLIDNHSVERIVNLYINAFSEGDR